MVDSAYFISRMRRKMPATSLFPKYQLNNYFQSQPVLFQFILNEFLMIGEENREWPDLILKGSPSSAALQKMWHMLFQKLNKLSFSPQDHMWQLPWNFDAGIFTKLKNYSYLYARNAEIEDPYLYQMHDLFHKTWMLCKQTIDIMENDLIPQHPGSRQKDSLKQIKLNIERIQRKIKLLKKFILTILKTFEQNENVLFFLLRHHERFSLFFEKKFVFKFFSQLFSESRIEEVRAFLIHRYAMRGFDHLLPIINEKFDEIYPS